MVIRDNNICFIPSGRLLITDIYFFHFHHSGILANLPAQRAKDTALCRWICLTPGRCRNRAYMGGTPANDFTSFSQFVLIFT